MKYLVTGGAGNIACQLSHRFADAEVVLADNTDHPFSQYSSNARYCHLDVTDEVAVHEFVAEFQPDIILHFASLLSGQSESDRPAAWSEYARRFHVFEASVKHKVDRVVFLSSIASFEVRCQIPCLSNANSGREGFTGLPRPQSSGWDSTIRKHWGWIFAVFDCRL